MTKCDTDLNSDSIKSLFLKATDFIYNGRPIVIGNIEEICTFQIEEGDFKNGKYRFKGIAKMSIENLSQLYEFEGYSDEEEIKGSIIIKKTH